MARSNLVGRSDDVVAHRGRGKSAPSQLRIFLNYRREETSGHAGRLYDELVDRFGEGQVFMDVDTIDPGADFVAAVKDAVGACDAFIAVIGRHWLQVEDTRGRRRLDNPEDFVRLEIEAALDRNVRLIPALVQDAEMPPSDELPDTLIALARRNALKVSDDRWRYDVGRLVAALERLQREKEEQARGEREAVDLPPAATPASSASTAPVGDRPRRPSRPSSRLPRRRATGEAVAALWGRVPRRLVLALGVVAFLGVGAAFAQSLIRSPDSGPPTVNATDIRVPNVVGATQRRAIAAVRRLGLKEKIVRVRGPGQKGKVVAQAPAQGTSIARNSRVELKVAAGPLPKPKPALVAVPKFVRAPGARAISRLRQQGLRVWVVRVHNAKSEGWVLAQDPRGGKRVRRGSRVNLTVSAGPLPESSAPKPEPSEQLPSESERSPHPDPTPEEPCRDRLGRPCGQQVCTRRDRLGRCIS